MQQKNDKILIVEDNQDNSSLAEKILHFYHFKTDVVTNGTEALKYCASQIPQLILMDISLPDMDGFEVTKKLRKQESFENVPIVALSAHVMQGIEESVIQSGMDDFLSKPFLPIDLYNKVSKYIK